MTIQKAKKILADTLLAVAKARIDLSELSSECTEMDDHTGQWVDDAETHLAEARNELANALRCLQSQPKTESSKP